MWWKIRVEGGLEHEAVRRLLRAHENRVIACIGPGQPGDGQVRDLEVNFTVAANGSVRSSVAAHRLPNDHARGLCIAEAFRGFQFPASEDGSMTLVTVTLAMDAWLRR